MRPIFGVKIFEPQLRGQAKPLPGFR